MQAREWGGGGGRGHSRQGTSLSEGEELGRGTDCAGSGVRLRVAGGVVSACSSREP